MQFYFNTFSISYHTKIYHLAQIKEKERKKKENNEVIVEINRKNFRRERASENLYGNSYGNLYGTAVLYTVN